jgi:hypothetical protein
MVKILEFHEPINTGLNFDIVDDTCVHMRNDPMFYRKEYFPAIAQIADMQREGTNDNPQDILMPMIEKGITDYCTKYKIARHPDEIFRDDDRKAIFDKIYKEEMKQIEKGEYK